MRAAFVLAVTIVVPPAVSLAQVVQAPARDAAKPRTGTSRIRGRVVAADSGTPVRKATVRLVAQELPQGRSKLTDVEGRYDFTDLPSGSYYVMASKTGFLMGAPGATRPNDPGKSIKVGDAETATVDDITLARACAVAGRVVDEFGDPVAGSQVSVFRYQSLGGVRRAMPSGSGSSTNDLGQFRVYALQPGTYYVSARAPMGGETENDDRTGYAQTYYPGTANASEAQPVQVVAGQDAASIEIMLTQVRVVRVSGTAFDSRGRPASNSMISAMAVETGTSSWSGPSSFGRILPDGTFTINNVAPGDYYLELRVSSPVPASGPTAQPRNEYGRVRVAVGGSDVTGVTVQAGVGASISGQVVFEGGSAQVKPGMTVMTQSPPSFGPIYNMAPGGQPAQVAADGTFQLTGVFGERLLRVTGLPTGWFLKAIYVNNRDLTDTPIAVEGREQIAGVQIVLTDRVSHLTGTVTGEDGQPADTAYVLVLPDDAAKMFPGSRSQRTSAVRAGAQLKIDALPPGDYIALAFTTPPQNFDFYDPDLLQYARKIGTRFSLGENETKSLALKTTKLPEKQ